MEADGELYCGAIRLISPEPTDEAHRALPIKNFLPKKIKSSTEFHQGGRQNTGR